MSSVCAAEDEDIVEQLREEEVERCGECSKGEDDHRVQSDTHRDAVRSHHVVQGK